MPSVFTVHELLAVSCRLVLPATPEMRMRTGRALAAVDVVVQGKNVPSFL